MTDYAIDQNIIYDAWRGKKIDKTPALFEKKFIYDFLPSAHKLLLNSTIEKKFTSMKNIKMEDTQYADSMIVPMFMKLIFSDHRVEHATENPVTEQLIKKCDNHYVAVTLDKKGILVTHDGKLKTALQSHQNLKECNCMEIQEAIQTL
jgi:hypothetical protein